MTDDTLKTWPSVVPAEPRAPVGASNRDVKIYARNVDTSDMRAKAKTSFETGRFYSPKQVESQGIVCRVLKSEPGAKGPIEYLYDPSANLYWVRGPFGVNGALMYGFMGRNPFIKQVNRVSGETNLAEMFARSGLNQDPNGELPEGLRGELMHAAGEIGKPQIQLVVDRPKEPGFSTTRFQDRHQNTFWPQVLGLTVLVVIAIFSLFPKFAVTVSLGFIFSFLVFAWAFRSHSGNRKSGHSKDQRPNSSNAKFAGSEVTHPKNTRKISTRTK